ncbi:hypothetical protein [Achromobacter sp. MFA1 R4]|uniref:hypothetical protein n=1 Tax=Achromobacter sp. MFA1 R4 TaxID=1881016 RepID=UPI00095389D6|nr:hypothetical protein [Achromobacter sp. MFA1 R4]SIT25248.1 hypothetical protein SAMN05428937_2982 [Achromobacter sp. MFA1 R4]
MSNNTPAPAHEAVRNEAIEEYFWNRMWLKTPDNVKLFEAGFDHAYALLSKLRAPVADERDRNATISEVVGLCNRIPGATTWNAAEFMYDEMHRRAALASAPVAGEAQPVAWFRKTDITEWTDTEPETDGWTPLYEHAAPQASEAVRQQRAGDVVAVLVYRSKGRSGVHGQTIGADGAGEFAVLYRGDEFAALVKANEEIRALEAAGHRLDFAEIIHGEGYSGPMLRQEYVTRAALSAQPGAQKNGGSDAE